MAQPLRKFFTETPKCFKGLQGLGEKGIVLPLVLSYVLVFTVQITGLAESASHTQRLVQSQQNYLTSFYLADAATQKALAAIRLYITANGSVPDNATLESITKAPNVGPSKVTYKSLNTSSYFGSDWMNKALTSGNYAGLNANTRIINVAVTAEDTKNGVAHRSTVNQTIEIQAIPIFQFGIFYQGDLEILPGINMDFIGPVHTNSDLYVGVGNGSTSTLKFDASITAYGAIVHRRKDGNVIGAGDVMIKNDSGVYKNMKNADNTWLDGAASDWSVEASSRWGNKVRSSVHGAKQLILPIPASANPHILIEKKVAGESSQIQTQKIDYKAHLRIIDGVAQDKNGSVVELRYCSGGGAYNGSCPSGQSVVNPISNSTFHNYREAKMVKSTDINVGLLNASPEFSKLVDAHKGVVVYFSDRRNQASVKYQDSVRLVNGSVLPNKGLTIASENPMYVKGNFNTVNKQPSGLVSDAFNILSNSWNDANSSNAGLRNKIASATSVNAVVVTGNTNTVGRQYNGGFENIHRLHENWNNVHLTYSGSVAVLYNSQKAIGNWVCDGNHYNPPIRNWSFDPALSNPNYSIPGLPSVFNVAKAGYEAA